MTINWRINQTSVSFECGRKLEEAHQVLWKHVNSTQEDPSDQQKHIRFNQTALKPLSYQYFKNMSQCCELKQEETIFLTLSKGDRHLLPTPLEVNHLQNILHLFYSKTKLYFVLQEVHSCLTEWHVKFLTVVGSRHKTDRQRKKHPFTDKL